MQAALVEIRSRVERGSTLSLALAEHPHLFSPLYVGLVRAGERSGDVETSFARLAAQLERAEQLRGRILSASIYPLLLATAGTCAVSVLLFFVLPKFATLLEGSGAKLPASTSMMLALRPELVRKDQIRDDPAPDEPALRGLFLADDMMQKTDHGAVGYPSLASAEKGRAFLNAAIERTAEVVRALLARKIPT